MATMLEDTAVEPVLRTLLGAIDVDGGATDEQRAVLRAIVAGAWQRGDLDDDEPEAFSPAEAADAIPRSAHRRARELLVLMEMCRHPLSEAQCDRVDEYFAALGESERGAELVRDMIHGGAAAAMADYQRYLDDIEVELEEPSLKAAYPTSLEEPDHELAARLQAMHDLPAGTLGSEYVEFYRRNGLTLPGDDPYMPAVFVAHDMCHVIGGYEPTGQGEIALGAMQLSVTDSDAHWVGFLGNLAVHEAGFLSTETITGKEATMTRAHAPELVAHAIWRGEQCTGDWTTADHLAIADVPLVDVRDRYGVVPPDPDHPDVLHVRE
jgi:hypothetical protein